MSFFSRVDKPTAGCVLQKLAVRRSAASFTAGDRRCNHHVRPFSRKQILERSQAMELNNWFINALVLAGRCQKHRQDRQFYAPFTTSRRPQIMPRRRGHPTRSVLLPEECRRPRHSSTTVAATKDELLSLMDEYSYSTYTNTVPLLDPLDPYQDSPGPHLMISDKVEDISWPPPEHLTVATTGSEKLAVDKLRIALRDRNGDPEYLYQLYRALPTPRISFLTAKGRHVLLQRLGTVERKDEHSMLRYLSVVDDMKVSAIPLTVSEWNMATSFAGRYVGKTTESEVEASLRIFKEMEQLANVRGDSATFNILFDVATKAGKFHLGELIYKEMENRGLAFNRFHHVSVMYYHGLRGDGDSVRSAYKTLVIAGEIVDTVVLNCLISSLIRAREPQAAMQVYERMKVLHGQKTNARLPSLDYTKRRSVAKSLIRMAEDAKKNPGLYEKFANNSIIAPDSQTFRILLQHVAVYEGELRGATQLLDEMRRYHVPLNGSIFLALFKAFAIHGGERNTLWTAVSLESVWEAYLFAVEKVDIKELYLGMWIIIWTLRAFSKCSGQTRMLEIWDEIRGKWQCEERDLAIVTELLLSLTNP